jgi:hypothetical protein
LLGLATRAPSRGSGSKRICVNQSAMRSGTVTAAQTFSIGLFSRRTKTIW